jgi:hypothetical protein
MVGGQNAGEARIKSGVRNRPKLEFRAGNVPIRPCGSETIFAPETWLISTSMAYLVTSHPQA